MRNIASILDVSLHFYYSNKSHWRYFKCKYESGPPGQDLRYEINPSYHLELNSRKYQWKLFQIANHSSHYQLRVVKLGSGKRTMFNYKM